MLQRPRRNRRTPAIRTLVGETEVRPHNFIYPVFIVEGKDVQKEIPSLPGQFRHSVDNLLLLCEKIEKLGIPGMALFPKINESLKNKKASEALNSRGLVPHAVREVKKHFPDLVVMTDIALDPFSSDGHDGIVENGKVLNDATNDVLAQMAVVHAEAGADYVGPSDMMDGRIKKIRQHLDENNFTETGIISYSAKYASQFYGPFRDALDSAPRAGDKKTYQMDPANSREALRELKLDLSEGADMVMVKPALAYLDIIKMFKTHSSVPVAAYNVSGEYAMIKAAAEKGLLDGPLATHEMLTSIKRAGADVILSYFAIEYCEWLNSL